MILLTIQQPGQMASAAIQTNILGPQDFPNKVYHNWSIPEETDDRPMMYTQVSTFRLRLGPPTNHGSHNVILTFAFGFDPGERRRWSGLGVTNTTLSSGTTTYSWNTVVLSISDAPLPIVNTFGENFPPSCSHYHDDGGRGARKVPMDHSYWPLTYTHSW